MRKSVHHILLPLILIGNLLFGQVVVNFLHNPHNEHEPDVKTRSDKASVHRHGEHCKVCSLEVVTNLLAATSFNESLQHHQVMESSSVISDVEIRWAAITKDRAPPVF